MGHSSLPQAVEASAPAALAAADAERVRQALASALAESTRRAYLGHWAAFGAWCGENGYAPAPAAPQTVAAHLAAIAGTVSAATLKVRRAAAAGPGPGPGGAGGRPGDRQPAAQGPAVRTHRVEGKGPQARAGRHRAVRGAVLCRAAALGGRGAGVGRRRGRGAGGGVFRAFRARGTGRRAQPRRRLHARDRRGGRLEVRRHGDPLPAPGDGETGGRGQVSREARLTPPYRTIRSLAALAQRCSPPSRTDRRRFRELGLPPGPSTKKQARRSCSRAS